MADLKKEFMKEARFLGASLSIRGDEAFYLTLETSDGGYNAQFKLSLGTTTAHNDKAITGASADELLGKLYGGSDADDDGGFEQIRSSYLVAKDGSDMVTVFIAEKEDGGTYRCIEDQFPAEGNPASPEIGTAAGGDFLDAEEGKTKEEAIAWIAAKETALVATGTVKAKAYASDSELPTHYTKLMPQAAPTKKPQPKR